MAKKSGTTKHDLEMAKLLGLGGRKIPAGFAKANAAMKSILLKEMDVRTNVQMQGVKLYGKLKGGSPIAVDDPANRETLDAILRLHERVASKKLPSPKVAPGRSRLTVVVSGTRVPPFDFEGTLPTAITGNPTLSGTANVNGQISATVVTPRAGASNGAEQAQVGIQVQSPVVGTLTISATPTYSFEWLTNSLNFSPVGALGGIMLAVTGENDGNTGYQPIFLQCVYGQIQFNFEFGVQQQLSVSVPVLPSLIYSCSVAVYTGAIGVGWPGSLAVAMVSATVPSISYEFVGEIPPRNRL